MSRYGIVRCRGAWETAAYAQAQCLRYLSRPLHNESIYALHP
jgi:hypothetical protein